MLSKIPYDKKLHFGAGFLIAIIAIVISSDIRIALLAACLAGIAKEVYDQITYGGFDWKDMIATWIGGIVGSGLYVLLFMKEVFGL